MEPTTNIYHQVGRGADSAGGSELTSIDAAVSRAAGSLLQSIIDSVPVAILLLHYPEMEIGLMNAGFRQIIGGESLDDLLSRLPADVRKSIVDALEHAYGTGERVVENEVPFVSPDGRPGHYRMYFVPQAEAALGDIMVILVDITAQVSGRKKVEELAGFSDLERRRLRSVLESMPIAILVVDDGGNIVVANEALRALVDVPSENIYADISRLEGRWSETGMSISEDEMPLVKALRGESISSAMTDLITRDGTIRTVIGSGSPIMVDGRINGAVIAFLDITGQREVEREAAKAMGDTELYLDLLTHDINNLNSSAKAYLELLLGREGLDQRTLRYATSSHALMGDIGRLVENVRKLHRAEDRSLHRHIIDVNALINDVVATHLNDPSGKVQITVRPGKQALVFGNALLRDVFDNLIENAVKHSGGEVQIEVIIGRFMTEGKEFVRVAVTDTGPGISDEVKKTLFNRMQRGHTAASGRGLGLYLAKTVLEMCDGRIWVDDRFSDDPGRGARFVVLIPAADEQ